MSDSVCSSSSGRSGRRTSTIEEWCDQNPNLSQYLEQLQIMNKVSLAQFQAKRQGSHNRSTDALLAQIKKIETKMEILQQDLSELSQIPYPSVSFLGYESNTQNMAVRKLAFVCRTLQIQKIDILSKKFGALTDFLNENRQMMRFFSTDIIPPNQIYRIKDSFFEFKFNDKLLSEEKHLQMLKSYTKKLRDEISHFPKPQWAKDFNQFLIDISCKGVSHLDRDISYFTYLEEEISLSRALFMPNAKMKTQIDDYLRSDLKDTNTTEFVSGMMDICEYMIPEQMTGNDQQSACILLLFRAVFNRFYERYPNYFVTKTPLEDIIKVDKLRQMPAKMFTIPMELVASKPEGIISNYFKSDPFFLAASQFLSLSIFMSNPVDVLYYIHKCLLGIQKGALIHRIGPGSTAKMEDVKSLLCFDDLFSLFLGTLMASDMPDIYYIGDFLSKYSPRVSLSPSFEYALANTEALVTHCYKLDIDEMIKKSKDIEYLL